MTFWLVLILIRHFGLCIFSSGILGCTYSQFLRIGTTQNVILEYENMENPKCNMRIWEYIQPKVSSYSHMTIWVVHIIIWHFGLYLFSDYILGCTYSYILRWHIGLCILSDDTLGCIYSHILIFSKCHLRICTTQNVIWEYAQPKMSYQNKY
jgi:hypothetical protein